VDAGFGGEDFGGLQYHSIYDDFYWFTHYSDTDFAYGRALAQTMGTMVMRLGDAEVLPFEFGDFSETIRTYLTELKKLAADQRAEIEERNKEIDEGVFQAAADPHQKYVPPAKEALPPYLNFAPLENAVDALSRGADRYEKALAAVGDRAPVTVNARLIESERVLTDHAGLPDREWFRHLIYAPGLYTGYGVKTIPGVRESIEQKKWNEANAQMIRAAKVLDDEARLLTDAATILAAEPRR